MKVFSTIVLASDESGDWIALYLDGRKVAEGHSLAPFRILEALGFAFGEITYSLDAVEEGSAFPETLTGG